MKIEMLNRKLTVLKELDETIDFSKSTLQIEIMLAFLLGNRELTPSNLVELMDERRKAILDALRKMQLKGIIRKEGERNGEPIYVLTETGEKYSQMLKDALGLKETPQDSSSKEEVLSNRDRIVILKKITGLYHIYNAIVYLANSSEGKMDLSKLSSLVGLSPERAKSYLDAYSRPPIRIFRRIVIPSTRKTFYKLEKEGWAIYYKSMQYMQFKSDFIARTRLKLRMRMWRFRRVREVLLIPLFLIKILLTSFTALIGSLFDAFFILLTLSFVEFTVSLLSP
ncbi:MAG: hypothetical protein QXR98_01405 [Fervidicoccaceae archaeon]